MFSIRTANFINFIIFVWCISLIGNGTNLFFLCSEIEHNIEESFEMEFFHQKKGDSICNNSSFDLLNVDQNVILQKLDSIEHGTWLI